MSISASSEDRRERTLNMFPRFQLPEPSFNFKPVLESQVVGGAERDRTDDLKLAKLALSQLSYSPNQTQHPP